MNRLLLLVVVCVLTQLSLFADVLKDQKLFAIHGFSGSAWNLYYLTRPLEKEQMNITYWDYPSKEKYIEEHAEDLVNELKNEAANNPGQPIHFLTHSMGGLVLRAALNHPECPPEAQMGRAALLVPPNQGAVWGRILGEYSVPISIAREFSGKQLMSEIDFEHLGQFPEAMEVLVVAGNFGFNPFLNGENDGVVMVEETYLSTPHRHIVVKQGHKSILLSRQVAELIHEFISEFN
jgi:pimeloyl-ACP methyl ester carboxylesterase